MRSLLRLMGILAAAFGMPTALPAQEPQIKVLSIWDKDLGVGVQASLRCVGAMPPPMFAHPWGVLVARELASSDQNPLADWKFVFDKALALDRRYLDRIKDRRPLPDLRLRGLDEIKGADAAIYLALNQAIHRVDQATQEMMENSAEVNKHVTYADLSKNPAEWRGKVIPIKGKLAAVRKVHAPRLVEKEVKWIYYAYINGPTRGAPPYAIVFTELPLDLEVNEKQNAIVTMNGYFLGLIRFQADKENRETQKDVISPYLVGKTLIVNEKGPVAKSDDEPHSYYLVVIGLGGFVLMGAFGALALLWFRRGDNKVQSQLLQVREKNSPFTLEAGDVEPAPIEPVDHPNGTSNPAPHPGERPR